MEEVTTSKELAISFVGLAIARITFLRQLVVKGKL